MSNNGAGKVMHIGRDGLFGKHTTGSSVSDSSSASGPNSKKSGSGSDDASRSDNFVETKTFQERGKYGGGRTSSRGRGTSQSRPPRRP